VHRDQAAGVVILLLAKAGNRAQHGQPHRLRHLLGDTDRVVQVLDHQHGHPANAQPDHRPDQGDDSNAHPAWLGRDAGALHNVQRIGALLQGGHRRGELGQVAGSLVDLLKQRVAAGLEQATLFFATRIGDLGIDELELGAGILQLCVELFDLRVGQLKLALLGRGEVGWAVEDQLPGDLVGDISSQHRIGVLDAEHQHRGVGDHAGLDHLAEVGGSQPELPRHDGSVQDLVGLGQHRVILSQVDSGADVG